jgi:hypothetical protein
MRGTSVSIIGVASGHRVITVQTATPDGAKVTNARPQPPGRRYLAGQDRDQSEDHGIRS